MPDKLPDGRDFDLSQLPSPCREHLGSTSADLTPAATKHLTEQLGIRFRYLWDLRKYVIGSCQITEDSDDDTSMENSIFLRATRHWNASHPGLKIQMSWWPDRKRPAAAFIEDYRRKVTAALDTLPSPASSDTDRP